MNIFLYIKVPNQHFSSNIFNHITAKTDAINCVLVDIETTTVKTKDTIDTSSFYSNKTLTYFQEIWRFDFEETI